MKMIQFKYAIISAAFLLGGMTTGCDTLDIDNLETYDESMVWGDLNLAQAYVNNLLECFCRPKFGSSDGHSLVFGYDHGDWG